FILYEAKRVYQGQAPYRDFFDFVTPGAFYLYALAYAIGAVSVTSARAATSLLHAISVVSTYFLTPPVAAMGEAIIAGLLVVVICLPVWIMASHHLPATDLALPSAALAGLGARPAGGRRRARRARGVLASGPWRVADGVARRDGALAHPRGRRRAPVAALRAGADLDGGGRSCGVRSRARVCRVAL